MGPRAGPRGGPRDGCESDAGSGPRGGLGGPVIPGVGTSAVRRAVWSLPAPPASAVTLSAFTFASPRLCISFVVVADRPASGPAVPRVWGRRSEAGHGARGPDARVNE